jgi:predicted RNA-binding protein YlxR (DUF448 family)
VRAKADLVRLVRRADGIVVHDPTAPGRGAYVCADAGCLDRAMRSGRLSQAFRKPSEMALGFAEEVRERWQRQRSR